MLACTLVVAAAACTAIEPPSGRETVHLYGSPYQRGLQHGRRLESKIRSFFTTMLTASLLPYVNRERPDIASALHRYAGPEYDRNFSYKLLLDSAEAMKGYFTDDQLDELRGVADGSGVPLSDILVLNTVFDSVMTVRGVALALRLSKAPGLLSLDFGDLGGDGIDNDGDGATDEKGEGRVEDYDPSPRAQMVEVPTSAKLTWVIGDPDGVDPETVRAQLDDRVFVASDPAFEIRELPADEYERKRLSIRLTPPAPLPAAATVTLVLMAGDRSVVDEPPPRHARFMRDERITFTTVGKGRKPREVPNTGRDNGRGQPAPAILAVRGTATPDGTPLLAQHFSLLDANTSHRHSVLFVHHPDSGPSYAYVGWAGLIWGFSGLNDHGLAYAVNYSDTLKSSTVNGLLDHIAKIARARLLTSGVPIGMAMRTILASATSAQQAAAALGKIRHTMGWNVALLDKTGSMRAVEIDADLGGTARVWAPDGDPAGLDEHGRRLASVGPDDLRMSVHFVKNVDDMPSIRLAIQGTPIHIRPQRGWSSYYFRSLRTFGELGTMIAEDYGRIDVGRAESMLADPALVDTSDSMNAVVIEPAALRLHTAMGTVPATDSPFLTTTLETP